MRILVVDDSVIFRSQIKSALDGVDGIVVAQTAANGKIALDRLAQTSIDVVILDLEMPEMDGITTLKEMRKQGFNQKVIVFSATSRNSIDSVFAALEAGASDFITKPNATGSLEQALEGIKAELVPKILQFKRKLSEQINTQITQNTKIEIQEKNITKSDHVIIPIKMNNIKQFKPRAIGIGSSTGGPNALNALFEKLKGETLSIPIFIAQHMPPNFTEHLAKSIESLCGHRASEAKQGEIVEAGRIYVAPGDFHMTVEKTEDGLNSVIRLDQGPKRNSVRPAVDNLFESLAKVYGNLCAAFVLTGMGEDGMIGAKAIKSSFGAIMIQDEASCVVWGMPGAVYASGAYDAIGNIQDCAQVIIQMAK